MQFLSSATTATTTTSLYSLISRHFTSATKLPKIPSKYRSKAIKQAQQALTDYLHTTRSLPFTYAEHITKNSLSSLSYVVAKVEFSPSTFTKSFQRFLRYHPINEFEFFYESIGIDPSEIGGFLPANKFFFSEDGRVLNAACALSGFGFPWNMLGKLYKEHISIFGKDPNELTSRLCGFKAYGFNNVSIIGICLAFPYVLLGGECELSSEIDALFDDLKRVFVDYDLMSCVECNVDDWYAVCRKIRLFYDLGCEKGNVGELMGRRKSVFLEYPEEDLVEKAEFFCRLSVGKENVGLLLLQSPEILNFDLESPMISVLGFLKYFGLKEEELKSISLKYPCVLGRNKMANLPHVMRALDLHEWFFNKVKKGDHYLLGNYVIGHPDEDLDKDFKDSLERIQSSRTPVHTFSKLNFLHELGFGENVLTIKVLAHVHGSRSELEERFNCLLRTGIEFSKLFMMIRLSPKILNQNPENLKQKVNFLCQDMGSPLQCLDTFPAYLCYDLEKRIKPRYRFHMWLTEKGLCTRNYSFASMIATSEKNFIARLFGIHPAAPKQWLECFLSKNQCNSCEDTLVS